MQTQLQTQAGWGRRAVHTFDQVQENLRGPDTPFNVYVLRTVSVQMYFRKFAKCASFRRRAS